MAALSGAGQRIAEWFGHLAITGGTADITPGCGEDGWSRRIGARFGLLAAGAEVMAAILSSQAAGAK